MQEWILVALVNTNDNIINKKKIKKIFASILLVMVVVLNSISEYGTPRNRGVGTDRVVSDVGTTRSTSSNHVIISG